MAPNTVVQPAAAPRRLATGGHPGAKAAPPVQAWLPSRRTTRWSTPTQTRNKNRKIVLQSLRPLKMVAGRGWSPGSTHYQSKEPYFMNAMQGLPAKLRSDGDELRVNGIVSRRAYSAVQQVIVAFFAITIEIIKKNAQPRYQSIGAAGSHTTLA